MGESKLSLEKKCVVLMISYPSIERSTGQKFQEFDAHVFEKIDGSNLRFEWTKKNSFCKYGTRHRLFDETDEVFGCAIELFHQRSAATLDKIAREQKWEKATFFCEFYGGNSFAGNHNPEDEKFLALIDVHIHKYGMIDIQDYLKLFHTAAMEAIDWNNLRGGFSVAAYYGKYKWNRQFVDTIAIKDSWLKPRLLNG
jgi:hypothetical protein